MLTEKAGWTIEYICDLSLKQISELIDGYNELEEFRNKKSKKKNGKYDGIGDGKIVNNPDAILKMPGFQLSEKAMQKIREHRQKQKGK